MFESYYNLFAHIFKEFDQIDPTFKREVFAKCRFSYCQNHYEEDEDHVSDAWPNQPYLPEVEKANHASSKVHFILAGQIHIMSKDGTFHYGTLLEGSYFGDISILLDQPNQFSYYYDPFNARPVLMLSIDRDAFLDICNKHPIPHEHLISAAKERQKLFVSYRVLKLIGYMKTIRKNPVLITKKIQSKKISLVQRVKHIKLFQDKLKTIKLLVK